MVQWSTALGASAHQRDDIERAAELVSLLELAWVNGSTDRTPEDEAAFIQLGEAAAEAVKKLGLPASSIDPALSFSAAVDGLMAKSAEHSV